MDWKSYYKSHTISAAEAAAMVKDGYAIHNGHGAGKPVLFARELVKRKEEVHDVMIFHGFTLGPAGYCGEDVNPSNIYHQTIFAAPNTRDAVNQGRARFIPCHFSDLPGLFRSGLVPLDIAVVHVSPPDRHGYCSFGISVDYERACVESARMVIAEVNPNMPRTCGDSLVHVSEIHYFIESEEPLNAMAPPTIGPVEKAIGQYIAELIQDGDCLQLGLGAVPDAIAGFLTDKKDLGIHTELISDGAMRLMESGVVNGRCKNVHRGKALTTFAAGTRALYDWLNENPGVEFYPVDYTNNARFACQNNHLISINSALQVDLTGQVNAESINARQYSGVGGQIDFVRAATWSQGGKSIIALASTAKGGKISRIIPAIAYGDAVTTSRNDVDYVVTEYGVAHLKGHSLDDRIRQLIAIAHPDFRAQLKEEYEKLHGLSLG